MQFWLVCQRLHFLFLHCFQTGTSGDTGSSAIESVRGQKNVDIFVLLPKGLCTQIQELQMTTVIEDNVHVFVGWHYCRIVHVVALLCWNCDPKCLQGLLFFAAAASWVISIIVTMPCCLAKERLLRVPRHVSPVWWPSGSRLSLLLPSH